MGTSFRQIRLAFSHYLRWRFAGEVGVGEAALQAGDFLCDLGQIFLQPLPQGIEALLAHG